MNKIKLNNKLVAYIKEAFNYNVKGWGLNYLAINSTTSQQDAQNSIVPE
jgi:hypothetical protein